LVGLNNELYLMYGTYIKIAFTCSLLGRSGLKKNLESV